jgi:hypothetical protein
MRLVFLPAYEVCKNFCKIISVKVKLQFGEPI